MIIIYLGVNLKYTCKLLKYFCINLYLKMSSNTSYNSCPICYETVDEDNKLILCDKCKLYRCGYCDEIDCCESVCAICLTYKIEGDGNNEKNCQKCNKTVCVNCIGITGCQTVEAICKNCFVYKCNVCYNKPLDINTYYLWDIKENYPTCNRCRNLY
jgi:hypothetical protein